MIKDLFRDYSMSTGLLVSASEAVLVGKDEMFETKKGINIAVEFIASICVALIS